jgi:2-polyprenyl-3-methyl-5-hydroxy-6-metoxy-1,4-benzoquinol methylase
LSLRWHIAQFFELLWWQRYLRKQDKTAYLTRKKAYWARFLEASGVAIPLSARVLDSGCGPAGIFTILSNQSVDAIDPLISQYEAKLPHFSRHDYPNVQFIASSIESFESNKAYDFVCCLNVINHVANMEKSLAVLANALHPEGTLLLSVDAHHFPWLKHFFRAIPGDILHPHQHALSDYVHFVEKSGLAVLRQVQIKRDGLFTYHLLVCAHQS